MKKASKEVIQYIRNPVIPQPAVQVENKWDNVRIRLPTGQGGLELEDGCEGGKHVLRLDVQMSNRIS